MALSLFQFKILGVMAINLDEDKIFRKGSLFVANELKRTQEDIQQEFRLMLHDGYLQSKNPQAGLKFIPLALTEKAQVERVKTFNVCFKDIKSVLLSKG